MTRLEIIDAFRAECPEFTARVIADSTLHAWCIVGNLEASIRARLVKGEGSFNSAIGVDNYNLATEISKFYDIDIFPGGGIYYDNDPLEFTTKAAQNERDSMWRDNSNGVPSYYWRRNNYIYFEKPASAVEEIIVDCVLYPDSFDSDEKTPFDELVNLTPFHYAIVLYLIKRAKGKVGKMEEVLSAKNEYNEYVAWMKKEVNRGIFSSIQLKPKKHYS